MHTCGSVAHYQMISANFSLTLGDNEACQAQAGD